MLKRSFVIASVLAVGFSGYFVQNCLADHHEEAKTESSHGSSANKDAHTVHGLTEEEFKRLHPSMPTVVETPSAPMKHPSVPVGSEHHEEESNKECSKTNSCGH